MGIVREDISHEYIDVTISIIEREKDEIRDPWRFARIEIDSFDSLTPRELRDLGHWLVKQGKRLGKEYKSNGAPRK